MIPAWIAVCWSCWESRWSDWWSSFYWWAEARRICLGLHDRPPCDWAPSRTPRYLPASKPPTHSPSVQATASFTVSIPCLQIAALWIKKLGSATEKVAIFPHTAKKFLTEKVRALQILILLLNFLKLKFVTSDFVFLENCSTKQTFFDRLKFTQGTVLLSLRPLSRRYGLQTCARYICISFHLLTDKTHIWIRLKMQRDACF